MPKNNGSGDCIVFFQPLLFRLANNERVFSPAFRFQVLTHLFTRYDASYIAMLSLEQLPNVSVRPLYFRC